MSSSVLEEAGPSLDRRIAKLILGRRHSANPPSYSTEVEAADALVARLESQGLTAAFEEEEGFWYCVFWAQRQDGVKERIATGSAQTRSLATCRAVLNLPLTGSGSSLALRPAESGWIGAETLDGTPSPGARRSGLRAVPDPQEDAPWLIPDDPGVRGRVRGGSGS